MVNPLNGPQVRDLILQQGYSATEATAYAWGNITQGIANTGKGALTAQSGNRVGSGAYKATKDLARGDTVCTVLCGISIGAETACMLITWIPMPGKFTTIAILKGVSYGTTKFRDMCANDPSNPFC